MSGALEWPSPPLTDGVVSLAAPAIEDASAIAAGVDSEVLRWLPLPRPYTAEHARAFVQHTRSDAAAGRSLVFVVRADGAVAGSAGLHVGRARAGEPEIGYWIAPHARRRGVATRVVRLMAAHAFAELGARRVELLIQPGNAASRAAATRAGATYEGVRRAGLRFDDTGEVRDAAVYSLLPADCPIWSPD